MRNLIYSLVFVTVVLGGTSSFSYNSDPKMFIGELVNDAIKTLSDKNISKIDKNKKIEIIALENIDINALSMYTLGDKRKTLDKENLEKYKNLFERYFLKSLTSRLNDYLQQKFEVFS